MNINRRIGEYRAGDVTEGPGLAGTPSTPAPSRANLIGGGEEYQPSLMDKAALVLGTLGAGLGSPQGLEIAQGKAYGGYLSHLREGGKELGRGRYIGLTPGQIDLAQKTAIGERIGRDELALEGERIGILGRQADVAERQATVAEERFGKEGWEKGVAEKEQATAASLERLTAAKDLSDKAIQTAYKNVAEAKTRIEVSKLVGTISPVSQKIAWTRMGSPPNIENYPRSVEGKGAYDRDEAYWHDQFLYYWKAEYQRLVRAYQPLADVYGVFISPFTEFHSDLAPYGSGKSEPDEAKSKPIPGFLD